MVYHHGWVHKPEWWRQTSLFSAADLYGNRRPPVAKWYRFGMGTLGIDTDDSDFGEHFQRVYRECAVPCPAPDVRLQARCSIRSMQQNPHVALLVFDCLEPVDLIDFSLYLFAKRGYCEHPSPVPGWRVLGSASLPTEPLIAARGEVALVNRRRPWQSFIASYAVNRVLALQRQQLFFHAASAGISGAGVLLMGAKGTGKTTTAMTLASRGHDFLGDEIAVVHHDSGEMTPFRRAVSIRPGPRSHRVAEHLKRRDDQVEHFPDGTPRLRVNIGELFPDAGARPMPLHSVMLMRRFVDFPRLEPFTPTIRHLACLQPLGCSFWGVSRGRRVMEFLALLAKARCYFLDVATPDATADLIETAVGNP